jgi:hypothetical protein
MVGGKTGEASISGPAGPPASGAGRRGRGSLGSGGGSDVKVTLCAPTVGFRVGDHSKDRVAAIEGLGLRFLAEGDPPGREGGRYVRVGDNPVEVDTDLETLCAFAERTSLEVVIGPRNVVEIRM